MPKTREKGELKLNYTLFLNPLEHMQKLGFPITTLYIFNPISQTYCVTVWSY